MNNNFGIFSRQDAERKEQEAARRERSNVQRVNRDLKTLAITGKISRFLEKATLKSSVVSDAVNQTPNPQASAPQITVPQIKGNEVDVEEPKRFGSTIEVSETGETFDVAFKLFVTTTPPPNPQSRISVVYGEVNKQAPSGIGGLFSPPHLGVIYLDITFNEGGEFSQSSISTGSSLPQNTPTKLYILIGRVLLQDDIYSIDRQAHVGDIIIRRQDICINGDTYVDFAFVANRLPILNP